MLVLGLTGNIGCGKSSLSNIFREDYNIDIIDADIISRNIFEDEILLKQVFEFFGDSIKNADGSLNMPQMERFMEAAEGMSVTLHRAFDVCRDPYEALKEEKKKK